MAVTPPAYVFILLCGVPLSRFFGATMYVPATLRDDDYPRVADYIYRHRFAKQHWDWEMFSYYVYSGLFANVTVSAFAVWRLTRGGIGQSVVLLLAVAGSLGYALIRGRVVRTIYDFYKKQSAHKKRG
jgi:hypothetical protein